MTGVSSLGLQTPGAAVRATRSRVNGVTFDALTTPERLTYLEQLEQDACRSSVAGHVLINQLDAHAGVHKISGMGSSTREEIVEAFDAPPTRTVPQ
jgi:hypothetical protein